MTRMIRNSTAVISFKSEAVIPRVMAAETHALYTMEPMITAVVAFTAPNRWNRIVQMITFARPMTMVPVPMLTSKNPFC